MPGRLAAGQVSLALLASFSLSTLQQCCSSEQQDAAVAAAGKGKWLVVQCCSRPLTFLQARSLSSSLL